MSKHKEAAQSFLKMAGMGKVHRPNRSIDIKQVYEGGDRVITHSLVTRQDPTAADAAVVQAIWRRFK